jgi:putative tricarboxylic transport membrane protein
VKHSDVYAGAIFLALSAGIYALTAGFDEVPAMLSQNVPPTFFPRFVIAIVAFLSVTVMVGGLRKTPARNAPVPPVVFATGGIVLVAGLLVNWIGTLPTLCLTSIVIPLLWGERRRLPVAALAVGLPAAIYLVFSVALGIRFPGGRLLTWLT